MMALGAVVEASRLDQLFLRIEIENALAGVADNGLFAGANFVIGLRTQHDLAGHAFVIANFGDAAAAELRDALVVAQQVFADAGAELVALGSPFGQQLFVFGGALAGLLLFPSRSRPFPLSVRPERL